MPTPTIMSLDRLLDVPGAESPPEGSPAGSPEGSSEGLSIVSLALLFAQSRRRGGGGGAPAELGLPQAPSLTLAPIAARSTSHYYAVA